MKKYISADLRVINLGAKDIIATSGPDSLNGSFHSEDATLVGGRRGFDDDYEDF